MKSQSQHTNGQKAPSTATVRPVAYENEMYRLTQLKAYELAQADDFKQSPQDYWLLAEEDSQFG